MNKKAIFVNTSSQVIVRFITLAVTLMSIKLLTNYLGTAGVGKFNTITTYINFFIVIADLGLFAVTVREISQHPDNEKKILANVMYIRLISAVLACIVAVLIVFTTKYDDEIKIGTLIASGFLFFNLVSSVYDMVLQYRLKMQFSALAELLSRIISVLALYLIVIWHGNFYWVTTTIALWGIFIFVFKWLFANRYIKIGIENDRQVTSKIFNMAWPLGIVFIVNNLYFKIDTLMLFAIKGAAATGIYTVAYKILETVAFIGSYLAGALKPVISQNIEHNKEIVASVIKKSISILILAAAPIVIISIAFNQEIVIFLSNGQFFDSAKVLIILVLTVPFIYLDVLLLEIFIASDARLTFLKISIFILLFNFIVNLILIPIYSYFGAAFTTLLSEFILWQIYLYFVRRIIPVQIDWKTIIKIIFISLITLGCAYILKLSSLHFIILIIISFAIYSGLLYIAKIYTLQTIKELLLGK